MCDLKHYKSGNVRPSSLCTPPRADALQFALRWRTEDEVVAGAGESTCGNTRCPLHAPRNIDPQDAARPALTTLELPFAYVEAGAAKSALVKVVLCARCVRKLMWRRNKEKARAREREQEAGKARAEGEGGAGTGEAKAVSSVCRRRCAMADFARGSGGRQLRASTPQAKRL